MCLLRSNSLLNRIYRNLLLVAALSLKLNTALYQSVKGIILADTNVNTRMDSGTALTIQNITGLNYLTIGSLCLPGATGLGITSSFLVETNTLFMSK